MGEFLGGDKAINRKGRPPGTGRKISQLKSVFNKLKKLSEKAIANVELSVNGKEVDKEVLSSSKWVVDKLQVFNKAILAEEEGFKNLDDNSEDKEESDNNTTTGFSLKMIK